MAGVWFTHCASPSQRAAIISRLATKFGYRIAALSKFLEGVQFPVGFLEDNFVSTVKDCCKQWNVSIAMDLTMKVIQESNPEIKKMP